MTTFRKPKAQTKRELIMQSNRWDQAIANMMGKPAKFQEPVPEKRVYTKSNEIPESQILKAVLALLKHHPKVAKVWRQNSGVFQMGDRYVRANTAKGMADIMGILKDGRTLAVETKSRLGRVEQHQWDFLKSINDAGGLAGVCRSVEDAVKLLENA